MHGKKFGRFLFAALIASVFILFFCACEKKENSAKEEIAEKSLVIWTYDTFNSEWGTGPSVSEIFTEKTGITIEWVSHGDGGEILSRLLLEKENSGADIILGVDQNMSARILDSELLEAYRPKGAENIFREIIFDEQFRLVPFDYSYFAVVYDSEKIPNPPKSLEELTDPRFKENLILIDPRTSAPGLGFFGWVKEVYGSGWKDYWRRLEPSILTVADGWSSGYGLFTQGEAPLVLSYTTSPGYHLEYEETDRYRTAIFSDGHPLTIESAGILRAAKNKDNAKVFLDFMVSPDFQNLVPLTNWMYPVIDIPLPESFSINPKSDKPLNPGPVSENELNEWAGFMLR